MSRPDPTLTEALAEKGITHERDEFTARSGQHVLKRGDEVLGCYRAMAAWEALKRGDFD